jgi:Family of unknown function (DUF6412)
MLLWVLTVVVNPAPATTPLLLTLAVVAAALLLLLAASGVTEVARPEPMPARADRVGARGLPRLRDPDAAGRPRPRAPSAYPTAV